jgi:WD40 repeat protein
MHKRRTLFNAITGLFLALSCAVAIGVAVIVLRLYPYTIFDPAPPPDYRVAWNPSSSVIAGSNGVIHLYTDSLEKMREFSNQLGSGKMLSLSWSPDGTRLVGSSKNGVIEVWNTASSQLIASTTGYAAYQVVWSPDGAYVAGGKTTDTVDIWDANTLKLTASLTGHKDDVRTIAWNRDGSTIASGADDQTICVWQVNSRQCVLKIETHSPVASVDFSPDGRLIAAGLFTGELRIWNVSDGRLQATLSSGTGVYGAGIVAWNPDGRTILSVDHSLVKLWNPTTGANIRTWTASDRLIQDASWSPDGSRIVTIDVRGTISIWNTATGDLLAQKAVE